MYSTGYVRVVENDMSTVTSTVTIEPQQAVCPHCGKCRHCGQPSMPAVPYTPSPYPVMPAQPIWYWPNVVYC